MTGWEAWEANALVDRLTETLNAQFGTTPGFDPDVVFTETAEDLYEWLALGFYLPTITPEREAAWGAFCAYLVDDGRGLGVITR